MKKNKTQLSFFAVTVVLMMATVLSLRFGAANISMENLWKAIVNGPNDTAGYIFWYSRLPRTLACLLAGAALAASGCILQSVLENPLASPNIIGVNAGAGLGVTICCAFGALSGWAASISAFSGALLATLLIVLIAKKTGASRGTVILAGVAMNSILTALRDALTALVPDAAVISSEFRVGGFSSVAMSRLLPAAVLILVALVITFFLLNEMDVLALGEDTAQSLGMNVRFMRILFLILAALLAGAAVSFSGLLGFVGLIIPHFSRMLIGSENRKLIPFSVLLGAGFVTLCDVLTRVIFAPHEFSVGILLAVLGGPFFLLLLFRKKGGRIDA